MVDAFRSASMSLIRGVQIEASASQRKKREGTRMNFGDQRIWWVVGVVVVILIIWSVAT